jgi:Outer membrane lipoprotein carrier protein LolA-like
MRRADFIVTMATCVLLPAARAQGFDLTQVTALLARNRSGQARFTEERIVGGLDLPLHAAGTLSFIAPDRFTRTTTEPRAESMEVQGNQLLLKRGGRTRQMAVDAIPELMALIEAVRGTLTGNAALLRSVFNTRVEGNAARWTLTLVPRDAKLAQQVRELKITGLHSDMRSVELWLAGGDRSVMSIEPLQPLASQQAAPR